MCFSSVPRGKFWIEENWWMCWKLHVTSRALLLWCKNWFLNMWPLSRHKSSAFNSRPALTTADKPAELTRWWPEIMSDQSKQTAEQQPCRGYSPPTFCTKSQSVLLRGGRVRRQAKWVQREQEDHEINLKEKMLSSKFAEIQLICNKFVLKETWRLNCVLNTEETLLH